MTIPHHYRSWEPDDVDPLLACLSRSPVGHNRCTLLDDHADHPTGHLNGTAAWSVSANDLIRWARLKGYHNPDDMIKNKKEIR